MKQIIFLVLMIPGLVMADQINADSEISSATLYLDRAEVTRVATLNLPAGRHSIVLSPVPQSLRADSLQVKGQGNQGTTILGVEFLNRPVANSPSDRVKVLNQQIFELESELTAIDLSLARINSERSLVKGVPLSATVSDENKTSTFKPRSAVEMKQILDFISASLAEFDAEDIKLNIEKSELAKKLKALKQELLTLRPAANTEGTIVVEVISEKSGKASIDVSYQVPSAGWSPNYNLMVNEDNSKIDFSLNTFAVINQQTGEDWKDVALTLSTARPGVGLYRPIPNPIYLEVQKPRLHKEYRANTQAASAPAAEMAVLSDAISAEDLSTDEMLVQSAQIENVGVLVYKIPGTVSLAGDGTQEKVKLNTSPLKGSLVNVAVPSKSSEVFREAKLTNITGQPLLPGSVSVFSNDAFIGTQHIALTQANKEFNLSVGLSDSVTVNRKLLKRYEDDSGVVRSFRRISSNYEVEIKNLATRAQSIVVLEPGVVSRDEKIKVEYSKMTPASLAKDAETRISNNKDILEWQLDLAANGTALITYESTVEFKSDVNVSGIGRL